MDDRHRGDHEDRWERDGPNDRPHPRPAMSRRAGRRAPEAQVDAVVFRSIGRHGRPRAPPGRGRARGRRVGSTGTRLGCGGVETLDAQDGGAWGARARLGRRRGTSALAGPPHPRRTAPAPHVMRPAPNAPKCRQSVPPAAVPTSSPSPRAMERARGGRRSGGAGSAGVLRLRGIRTRWRPSQTGMATRSSRVWSGVTSCRVTPSGSGRQRRGSPAVVSYPTPWRRARPHGTAPPVGSRSKGAGGRFPLERESSMRRHSRVTNAPPST